MPAESNELPNARLILSSRLPADLTIMGRSGERRTA